MLGERVRRLASLRGVPVFLLRGPARALLLEGLAPLPAAEPGVTADLLQGPWVALPLVELLLLLEAELLLQEPVQELLREDRPHYRFFHSRLW